MKKLTKKAITKIKQLHKKGLTLRAIAKKVRCSHSSVYYWIAKLCY